MTKVSRNAKKAYSFRLKPQKSNKKGNRQRRLTNLQRIEENNADSLQQSFLHFLGPIIHHRSLQQSATFVQKNKKMNNDQKVNISSECHKLNDDKVTFYTGEMIYVRKSWDDLIRVCRQEKIHSYTYSTDDNIRRMRKLGSAKGVREEGDDRVPTPAPPPSSPVRTSHTVHTDFPHINKFCCMCIIKN
ncbi:unnamed protein product [Onchocerca flexuosa]|nr:unnamed protein product [Onchocerca flexuosa]